MLYNENNLKCTRFASKDDTRPELSGVFITDKKTVATDSYSLLEVSVASDVKPEDFPEVNGKHAMQGCKPFIVPAKALKEIKIPSGKSLPILANVAISHVAEDRVEFMTTDLEQGKNTVVKRIDGTYPNYELVIPAGVPLVELQINGEYLANMAKAMGEISRSNGNPGNAITLKIFKNDCRTPIMFEVKSERQSARGILMPI